LAFRGKYVLTSVSADIDLPMVSIVIPAYNHGNYLPEAIASVLAQDYPRIELIVIDDGSTDNTAEILEEMKGDFHWESQINMGQSRTLSRGWKIARGDILGYLSADDILVPEAVGMSVSVLNKKPDAVGVYCNFNLIDNQSRFVRRVELPEFNYNDMLRKVSCPIGPGAFFKRTAYLKAGPWNPAFQQMPDYDFWLRLGLQGSFIHLSQLLAGFRVHEGSQTYSVTTPQRAAEPVTIVAHLLAHSGSQEFDSKLKNTAMASANLVSAQLHLRAGRFGDATDNVRQAWQHSRSTVISLSTLRLLLNALINRTAHRILWTIRNIFNPGRK
jgi:glycosyltransferase involved in cell wall biosynthesis